MGPKSIEEQLSEEFERPLRICHLTAEISAARDWRDRLRAIENYYTHPVVSAGLRNTPRDTWAHDPYEVDWPMLFTPIEAALWSDIRRQGVPFYPQYPVQLFNGKTYFADFANPQARVVLECDGRAFHNAERDRERDMQMRREQWTVYRFSGAECREDFNEVTMQRSSVSRALEQIARRHLRTDQPPSERQEAFE